MRVVSMNMWVCEAASHRPQLWLTEMAVLPPSVMDTSSVAGLGTRLRGEVQRWHLIHWCNDARRKVKSAWLMTEPSLVLFVTQPALPNQLLLFWQKGLYLPGSCPLSIINRAEGSRWGRGAQRAERSVGCIGGAPPSPFELTRIR